MLIAVDHGNYAIKTPRFSFVSGLTSHTVKPPLADEVLEYAGKYWTLTEQRLPYMRDKTKDERYFILTLFAIAKELKHAGELAPFASLDLAVGLPPEHYGMLKTKFSQYFKRQGAVNFVYNEKPVSISIRNVFVYPQAYAAIVQDKDKVLGSLRMFIIDVGGYTTDVLLLQNGKPDMRFCRSLETGIIPMSNDIIGKVSALHDMRLEDYHISAVLSGKETILPEDVKKLIRETATQYATDILDKLRELQVDLRSNPAIFIGGGSILFRSILERSELVTKAAFITDPKANAIGYEILAHGQLVLRSAQ
jgi:plasmid segregation protein ParM